MKYTNNGNLPGPFARAVGEPRPRSLSSIGVTDLIGPPQVRELTRRHYDELEDDVSDHFFAVLGTAFHTVMEQNAGPLDKVEVHVGKQYGPLKVHGYIDRVTTETGVVSLQDWKVAGAFSFVKGIKPEWEAQLNVYRLLYEEQEGQEIEEMRIISALRDWSKYKADTQADYPQKPLHSTLIALWPRKKTEKYIQERVDLHLAAMDAKTDADLPQCTNEERWADETTYAVMKRGGKRAAKVEATEQAAKEWALAKFGINGWTIETREGSARRCDKYCLVKQYCTQYAQRPGVVEGF